MKKTKKNYAIIVLLVLLLAIAVGYAAFQSVLTINGKATSTSNWEVKFTAAGLYNSAGAAADSEHYGTVSFTDDTVTATGIKLAYPGDAVNLRTVISNTGNLDATLTSVVVDDSKLAGTDITVTPATHTAGTNLASGEACTNEFVIKWNANSKKPSTEGEFTVTFTYDQAGQEITITPAHSDA